MLIKELLKTTLATLSLGLTSIAAVAIDIDEVMRLKQSGEIMPLEDIIIKMRQDFPGRIIEIELEREDGFYVYEIDYVDAQGLVWELELDARNGELLKLKRDD